MKLDRHMNESVIVILGMGQQGVLESTEHAIADVLRSMDITTSIVLQCNPHHSMEFFRPSISSMLYSMAIYYNESSVTMGVYRILDLMLPNISVVYMNITR